VHRRDDEVGWIDVREADFAFLGGLIMDGSLQRAHTSARAVEHAFDPTPLLAALTEGGLVSSITPVS